MHVLLHLLRDGVYLCSMISVFFCVFGAYDKAKDPKYAVEPSLQVGYILIRFTRIR